MKYDVIKSTDQLMGIWGLGKVEKKDSDTKMILHTKLEDYRREVSHGNCKIPQADLAEMLTELWCWRGGGITEEMLRAGDGYIKVGRGCIIARECDWPNVQDQPRADKGTNVQMP